MKGGAGRREKVAGRKTTSCTKYPQEVAEGPEAYPKWMTFSRRSRFPFFFSQKKSSEKTFFNQIHEVLANLWHNLDWNIVKFPRRRGRLAIPPGKKSAGRQTPSFQGPTPCDGIVSPLVIDSMCFTTKCGNSILPFFLAETR